MPFRGSAAPSNAMHSRIGARSGAESHGGTLIAVTVEFECETYVPAGVRETFDRSRSVDLHIASMSASRERAIAGVTAGLISEGEEVTWRAWHFEQVRGPFRSFRHEHEFRPDGSGTLMIDRVKFDAPLGPLGAMAELVIGPYLRRLIEKRNAHIAAAD